MGSVRHEPAEIDDRVNHDDARQEDAQDNSEQEQADYGAAVWTARFCRDQLYSEGDDE